MSEEQIKSIKTILSTMMNWISGMDDEIRNMFQDEEHRDPAEIDAIHEDASPFTQGNFDTIKKLVDEL